MDRFRVVLVDPRFAANIGFTARVCANFGISEFYGVSNNPDRWFWEDAQKIAVAPADQLLSSFRVFDSLKEAIGDCEMAIAFSRRTGQERIADLNPSQIFSFSNKRHSKKTALVFGNEETGLTDSEVLDCTHLCQIPTSDKMPSMNLSHAVAVILARIFEDSESSGQSPQKFKPSPVAPLSELYGLNGHFRELLIGAGLTHAGNPDRLQKRLWKIFEKTQLSSRDVKIIRGILAKSLHKIKAIQSDV